jgi:hypothetical protein
MMFTGSSANFSFPPPDPQTAIGPCGFAGVEGRCFPNLTATLNLTLRAGGSLVLPASYSLRLEAPSAEQCPPSGQGECEEVDGEGEIDENSGGVGDFLFVVRRPSTTQRISGGLQYVNHASGAHVQSVTFDSLVVVGNLATFSGTCTKNGAPCTFIGHVTSGPSGTYTISVSSDPTEGGILRRGNIRIFTIR